MIYPIFFAPLIDLSVYDLLKNFREMAAKRDDGLFGEVTKIDNSQSRGMYS